MADPTRTSHGALAAQPRNQVVALVVEPDNAVANLIRLVLEGHGCQVNITASGHVALDVANVMPPDLLVLDTSAPGVPAETIATALRMMSGPNLPILALSTCEQQVDVTQTGCYAVLPMPFELDEFVSALQVGLVQGRKLASARAGRRSRARPRLVSPQSRRRPVRSPQSPESR